jgi:hypothetical protein
MSSATLTAATHVPVDLETARAWFLSLQEHPERYTFESHAGFTFTEGDFGEPGARFQTEERFYGLRMTLHFELTDVSDTAFRFELRRPRLPVWGTFHLEPADDAGVNLRLIVGSETKAGATFLTLPLVQGAIRRQIQAEVDHIKASMMSLTPEA